MATGKMMGNAGKNLSALRRRLAFLEHPRRRDEVFSLDLSALDGVLGGGLPRAALHEIYASSFWDAASAAGFSLALAMLAAGKGSKIVWIRDAQARLETGSLNASGLKELGARPNDILLVQAHDCVGALRACVEAARCRAVGAVIAEIFGENRALNLTASRRLSLASENSGVTVFLLRACAQPRPSAAYSRWSVQSSVSRPLDAHAPGQPVFEVNLLRHRLGIATRPWRVEWNRDAYRFSESAPLSRTMDAVSFDRPLAADESERAIRRAG